MIIIRLNYGHSDACASENQHIGRTYKKVRPMCYFTEFL